MAEELAVIVDTLSNRMSSAALQLRQSTEYYEASYRLKSIGISTPPEMRCLTAAIGWPRMYVDSIEERLDIQSFRLAGSSKEIERLTEWWQVNGLDEESSMAHLDALIYSHAYVTIAAPGEDDIPGIPIIRAEAPTNMYAEVDPRTRKVTHALRVYEVDAADETRRATLYQPNVTTFLKQLGTTWQLDGDPVVHNLGVVPVVPLINRARLSDPDGRSEITPEIRSFTDAAGRTMMNLQAAAELMAVPQRVLFGVEAEDITGSGSRAEVMDAYLARILTLENEAGKAFQFSAADLRNFTEVLDQLAKHVASYTGLPPQYLSFSSDNPASAEAIKSAESRLVKKCERKSRMFGGSWEQVMRIATKVMDGDVPAEMNRLETVLADPATPTYASVADAVTKLYAGGLGVIPKERARIDLGYSDEERKEMKKFDDEDPIGRLNALVGAPAGPAPVKATPGDNSNAPKK